MIPDLSIDTEFEVIPYDGTIVFSKEKNFVVKNREHYKTDPIKRMMITKSIRKVKSMIFEF